MVYHGKEEEIVFFFLSIHVAFLQDSDSLWKFLFPIKRKSSYISKIHLQVILCTKIEKYK